MNKYFLRPFFDLHDPFFPLRKIMRPAYRVRFCQQPIYRPQVEQPQKNDAHALFEQFFKENDLKNQSQKQFFKKHYPETSEEKFDPFSVLEISKDATLEEAKDAYRKLAIKYHPKNDPSPQAEIKFAQVGRAYEEFLQGEKSKAQSNLGYRSFFDEFEKQVEAIFYPKQGEQKSEKSQSVKENKENDLGVLYSESSKYQSVNGKQTKYLAQKHYKKDGKLLKVTRQERLKDDGNIQITETIDNGTQVKKKTFIQEKDTKKIQS